MTTTRYEYEITSHDQECTCARCGYPMYVNDWAIAQNDNVFCSHACASDYAAKQGEQGNVRPTACGACP